MIHIYIDPSSKEKVIAHFFNRNVQYEIEGKRIKTVLPLHKFDNMVKYKNLELVEVKK